MENADQIKNGTEREVKLILSKLQELSRLASTLLYNQLQDVMTLRKQKNVPSLVTLRKELDEALKKHHQKMESERLEYKEDKND